MHSKLYGVIAAVVIGAALGAPALATPVGIFGTGDGLTDGASDSHWSYFYDANNSPQTGQAVVLTFPDHHYLPGNVAANGNWVPNQTNAKWIATSDSDTTIPTSPGFNGEDVLVTYSTSFNLSAFALGTVVLNINWTGDDDLKRVLLNGNLVQDYGSQCCEWGILHALAISSGFVSGVNTLSFEVRNDDNFKEGIIVQASGEGRLLADPGTPVPTPATLPLLAAGLMALQLVRRRGQNRLHAHD